MARSQYKPEAVGSTGCTTAVFVGEDPDSKKRRFLYRLLVCSSYIISEEQGTR